MSDLHHAKATAATPMNLRQVRHDLKAIQLGIDFCKQQIFIDRKPVEEVEEIYSMTQQRLRELMATIAGGGDSP